ncbi:hypothetical protein GW17_00008730 [Ensete ventricosum]|nr:hypothetical protein GW17_00008730 [Ensete ventricosum]
MQVWGRQWSYSRPDTGKIDTPYLQTHASPQGRRAWWKGTTAWSRRPTRAEVPPPDPSSTTPAVGFRGRIRGIHPSCRASTPSRDDRGRASAQGPEPAVLTQRIWRQAESTGQAPDLTLTFLALERALMSQERPFGNSGTEHHPKPNHPQPTDEAMVAVSTPNRFWRMMTDSGFPSPASNPASFVVTAKAFLGLTSQVQALAGMVQTIVPCLPQLVHSTVHQSAPPATPPQTESPAAPNRSVPPEVEPP